MSSNQQNDHASDSNDEKDEEENPAEQQLQGGGLPTQSPYFFRSLVS